MVPPPPSSPEDVGAPEVVAESSIRKTRERPTQPVPTYGIGVSVSQVRELEPESVPVQDRITEVPETLRTRLDDPEFETIPAPAWIDPDDEK